MRVFEAVQRCSTSDARGRTFAGLLMRPRWAAAAVLCVSCALGALASWPAGEAVAAGGEGCPNAALRIGYSNALPECRAYELVSPAGSEPNVQFTGHAETGSPLEADGTAKQVQASVAGAGFAYVTPYPPPGSPSHGEYLRVTRGASGWSAEQMIPPQSTNYSVICRSGYVAAYSPDLAKAALGDGVGQPGSPAGHGILRCGTDEPILVAGEPEGVQNLFFADREAGPYQLIDEFDQAPEGTAPADAWLQAASADLSHVVFNESAPLTPDAPAGFALYEWTSGTLRVVTRLPGGEPVEGSLANGYEPEAQNCCAGAETFTNAVSSDGSRISFVANGNLYLRINADQAQSPVNGEGACTDPIAACTIQVDAAQGGGQAGAGRFMWATPDGAKIFFTDEKRLTADSTAAPGEPDLYSYDLDAAEGTRLTDLTVDTGEPADVLGVSGIGGDGDHVYFVATGVLAAAPNSHGDAAIPGRPNLYLSHAGTTSFIASLDATPSQSHEGTNDSPDWEATSLTARVSPDGSVIAFNSTKSLTGYDNTDVATGEPDAEIFLYEAVSDRLSCVSCSPTGAPSTAYARIPAPVKPTFGGAAPFKAPGYLQRSLTDDGRVFFHTAERLLPGAVNGLANVYEYVGGRLYLISTGTSGRASYFYDASPSGDDVFFINSQDLPSGDQGAEFKVYDARVGGGFPVPPAPQECGGEGCRGTIPAIPPLSSPGTINALGFGNLTSAAATAPRKTRAQIRRERLVRALRICRAKHDKRKRRACEALARKRYGVPKSAKRKPSASRASGKVTADRRSGR
jgi:hypothetical protein